MAKLGQEDARRDGVYWLVEPLYGKRIHRLVQSTHHQGAQALAKTYRLALPTLVTPVVWSVATMKTAIARCEFASYRPQGTVMSCKIGRFLTHMVLLTLERLHHFLCVVPPHQEFVATLVVLTSSQADPVYFFLTKPVREPICWR